MKMKKNLYMTLIKEFLLRVFRVGRELKRELKILFCKLCW